MEKYILNESDNKLNNKLFGNLYMENSKIIFNGNNNIIYIDGDLHLVNSSIEFRGNNSIIYICNTSDNLHLDIKLYHNSTLYFGKDIWINKCFKIVLSEQTNAFFGNECLISYDTCLRTGDPHLIYDCNTHKRLNLSKSFYVGDHVWIGQHVMMLKGAEIGSGTIIGAMSVASSKRYNSNSIYAGCPIRKIKSNTFFLRDNCHYFTDNETAKYDTCSNNDFIYNLDDNTLSFCDIELNLRAMTVLEKIKYLKELTNNKNKNRFFI